MKTKLVENSSVSLEPRRAQSALKGTEYFSRFPLTVNSQHLQPSAATSRSGRTTNAGGDVGELRVWESTFETL